MNATGVPTEAEIDELVSHVLALRKDYVQQLLRIARVPFSGLRKIELRDRLREAIEDGRIDPFDVARYLDEVEPGGKQHVFLMRAPVALNDPWKDSAAVRRRLRKRAELRGLLDAAIPLLMPTELQLSRIWIDERLVEIVAVEARRYTERDEFYDEGGETDDGLNIELRAYVERVARSTVVLRWDTASRHASLHITQASGRGGLDRDYYGEIATRFAKAVSPWLEFSAFKRVNLAKALHQLHDRERSGKNVLTKSRSGRWETEDGSELRAAAASNEASFFADRRIRKAVGEVEPPASGQSGNLFWLPGDGSPLTERLHLTILAFDSRVRFMVPSSPDSVEYVLEQIRRLL